MSNWLTRAFARITGRTPAEDTAADGLSKQLNTAANTNRKSTSSGSKSPSRKQRPSSPGYGSSSRRSGSSDDTSHLYWSTGAFDSGSSGSYDSGGSCGGDGGGGGGCD